MKTVINLILLLSVLMNFAQNNNSVEFEIYKNGKFISLKNATVKLVKNLDTITCVIEDGRILIPKMIEEFSVVVNINMKTYVVDKVDFSMSFGFWLLMFEVFWSLVDIDTSDFILLVDGLLFFNGDNFDCSLFMDGLFLSDSF